MREPRKKTGRRLLIALAVIALMGGCFGAVGVYAHREMTKPRFENADPLTVSLRALPTTKGEALGYVKELYDAAVSADDVEGSWHTDAKCKDYDEAIEAPFPAADKDVIAYIWKQAGDRIRDDVYPKVEKVLQSDAHGAFRFDLTDDDVLGFTAEQGRYNDKEEYVDDEYYFITIDVDPGWIDPDAVARGETFMKFKEVFSEALTVQDAQFEVKGVKLSAKIDRRYDELTSLEITRRYTVHAAIVLSEAFAALAEDAPGLTAEVTLPYEATEKIEFFYYGAHFTQKWLAVQPGDWLALPARVQVHENELQENFQLRYTVSDPDVMRIDADGVMRVEKKGVTEETVTVTMTLAYGGHVYTDELPVYITTLEVKTDG